MAMTTYPRPGVKPVCLDASEINILLMGLSDLITNIKVFGEASFDEDIAKVKALKARLAKLQAQT